MPAKARCQITVRHYECDPLGHVNHAVYVHYFEIGRLEAMAEAGLPFSAILKQDYMVVASDLCVRYKAPALTEDVLDVYSCIVHFRGSRMLWQQELYHHNRGELLALARVTGVFTRANGRPTRIPPAMRASLEAAYLPQEAWHTPAHSRPPLGT